MTAMDEYREQARQYRATAHMGLRCAKDADRSRDVQQAQASRALVRHCIERARSLEAYLRRLESARITK